MQALDNAKTDENAWEHMKVSETDECAIKRRNLVKRSTKQ